MNCKNKEERDTFCGSETSFDAHKLYSTCLNDKACAIIFPDCLKLLHLMLIFPLCTAFVKRFFRKIKLVKTLLWNQLSQVNLENLLFIATEAPKTGFTDSEYDFFVNKLKKIQESMFEALFTSIWLPDIVYPVTWNFADLFKHFMWQCYDSICDSVLQITFLNKKLSKLCDVMRNSFELNTHLLFWEERFPCCCVAKQFFKITYFTDILSFEKFSKNLHQNLKLIFLFSTLFVHFKIGYRQSFIAVLRISFFWFMNLAM